MVVQFVVFSSGYGIKGSTKPKKKNKGVITTTHHLLDNKWRNVLEARMKAMGAKVESMDLKMESMSTSLLHIKELCYKLQVFFKQHIHCITFTC